MAFATAYLQIVLLAFLNMGADLLHSPNLTPHLMFIPKEQLLLRYDYGVPVTLQKRKKIEILRAVFSSAAQTHSPEQ
jgi:hypothetical protein